MDIEKKYKMSQHINTLWLSKIETDMLWAINDMRVSLLQWEAKNLKKNPEQAERIKALQDSVNEYRKVIGELIAVKYENRELYGTIFAQAEKLKEQQDKMDEMNAWPPEEQKA